MLWKGYHYDENMIMKILALGIAISKLQDKGKIILKFHEIWKKKF